MTRSRGARTTPGPPGRHATRYSSRSVQTASRSTRRPAPASASDCRSWSARRATTSSYVSRGWIVRAVSRALVSRAGFTVPHALMIPGYHPRYHAPWHPPPVGGRPGSPAGGAEGVGGTAARTRRRPSAGRNPRRARRARVPHGPARAVPVGRSGRDCAMPWRGTGAAGGVSRGEILPGGARPYGRPGRRRRGRGDRGRSGAFRDGPAAEKTANAGGDRRQPGVSGKVSIIP